MSIHGSCLCGSVKYEILGALSDVAFCHCSICRRTLGAAFGCYARVHPGDFKWRFGEALLTSHRSSPGVHRCSCQRCHSPLGAKSKKGELSWICLGSIIGDPKIRPEAHLFVGSKASWYEITDNLPQFDEWPLPGSEYYRRFG